LPPAGAEHDGFGAQHVGFGLQQLGFGLQQLGLGAQQVGFGLEQEGLGLQQEDLLPPNNPLSNPASAVLLALRNMSPMVNRASRFIFVSNDVNTE
jgi:hypothetical protein